MRQHPLLSSLSRVLILALGPAGCAASVGNNADVPVPDVPVRDVPVADAPGRDDGVCMPSTVDQTCNALVEYVNCPTPSWFGSPLTTSDCARLCPTSSMGGTAFQCDAGRNNRGNVQLNCTYCAIGRRVADAPHTLLQSHSTAEWYAQIAGLEAMAVEAFERLALDLERLGAPDELVSRTQDAANEERRHTQWTQAVARSCGAEPQAHTHNARAPRSLMDLALENEVEGCVRETMGAAMAMWQAQHATRHREMWNAIARDEASHAALSWDLRAWFQSQLPLSAWEVVQEAGEMARRELMNSAQIPVNSALVAEAGVPDMTQTQRILQALSSEVWSTSQPALMT